MRRRATASVSSNVAPWGGTLLGAGSVRAASPAARARRSFSVVGMGESRPISRRALLGGALAGAAAIGLAAGTTGGAGATTPAPGTGARPGPGTLPNPAAPPAADQLPLIENIVVVMMENHSYDNILGMMPGRGDGFVLGTDGQPTASNPWPKKSATPPPRKNAMVQAFPMPNPCQEAHYPYNTWDAYWTSYAGGRMDGFVKSQSGPVSMGYFEPSVMPFINSLASHLPGVRPVLLLGRAPRPIPTGGS